MRQKPTSNLFSTLLSGLLLSAGLGMLLAQPAYSFNQSKKSGGASNQGKAASSPTDEKVLKRMRTLFERHLHPAEPGDKAKNVLSHFDADRVRYSWVDNQSNEEVTFIEVSFSEVQYVEIRRFGPKIKEYADAGQMDVFIVRGASKSVAFNGVGEHKGATLSLNGKMTRAEREELARWIVQRAKASNPEANLQIKEVN